MQTVLLRRQKSYSQVIGSSGILLTRSKLSKGRIYIKGSALFKDRRVPLPIHLYGTAS